MKSDVRSVETGRGATVPAGWARWVRWLIRKGTGLGMAAGVAVNGGDDPDSVYSDTRHGNAPPAEWTYSLPSELNRGEREVGDVGSFIAHVSYVAAVPEGTAWRWLLGADYRLYSFDVPDSVPVPSTLQSAALALGFHGRFAQRWSVRLEVLPGVYGDLLAAGEDQFNAPFTVEGAYAWNDQWTFGGQVLVDVRRETPVVGAVGVTWRWSERWGVYFWLPRPQVEFSPNERWTFHLGASLSGGTFVVGDDFGTRRGDPRLDGAALDFREIRVGGGVRCRVGARYLAEAAIGWTIDRQFDFHEAGVLLDGDGAPFIQLGFGRAF